MHTREAEAIAREHYGAAATASALPGEVDDNFLLRAAPGEHFVLKVAGPRRTRGELEFQLALLDHLSTANLAVATPEVVATSTGQTLLTLPDGRLAHALTYLPGRPLRTLRHRPTFLLEAWGRTCARLTRALATFEHAGAHRAYRWCPSRAAQTHDLFHYLADDTARELARRHLETFGRYAAPYLAALPHQVNHNDAHEDNLLVDDDGDGDGDRFAPSLCGLIDVGDAVYAPRICELAVACAYAAMDCPDPVGRIEVLAKAYSQEHELLPAEIDALYGLTVGRLLITVTAAAEARALAPDNAYRSVSEQQAWRVLRVLADVHPRLATRRLRVACNVASGAQPSPAAPYPIIALGDRALRPLDLSVGSRQLGHYRNYADLARFTQRIRTLCGPDVGCGGYLEVRPCYTTDLFEEEGNAGPRWRTVHLGLDLWSPAGEPVHAPFAGRIHSFRQNDAPRDYGATIVLMHEPTKAHPRFYTLYGHLSRASLEGLQLGARVRRGQAIGTTGHPHENGGWPPHLHFQVITDLLGHEGDFPGVCFDEEREAWAGLCPDPCSYCGLDLPAPAALPPPASELLARRRRVLGRSLSLSYAQPLHIVRGAGAYLLDARGRRYLDTCNNVAHVGHEHPAVVEAIQRQAAVLNTNTRYLHEEVLAFAEELTATLPPALSVVHVVNSGSEANELALRMARTATGQRDVIAVEVGYHGNTGAALGVSSYKFDGPGGAGAPATTHLVPIPDVYRGPHRDPSTAGEDYARYFDEVIAELAERGRAPAAFICESILSCGGQVVLPEGYLGQAYAKTRRAGGLCIADEVQVGVGRVGSHCWGFELQGVVPDVVVVGKPIGNGHPLGAVVCTEAVAEAFAATGMEYFNTFGGNPVSCAAGRAVLRVVEEERLQANARAVGDYVLGQLRELQGTREAIGDVRGHGLFLGFELVRDRAARAPEAALAGYLAQRARERGVLLSTDGPRHNVIKLKPPLCFTRAQADRVVALIDDVLREAGPHPKARNR